MTNEMTLDEYRAMLAQEKKPPPPRDDREHQEQAALFAWAALNESRLPELRLLFAVPNGGDRHPAVAAKLKAEGVRAGVWDVLLPVAWGIYSGLWIEMKAGHNKLTPDQEAWGAAMFKQGYACYVCYDWTVAARHIVVYLGGVPEEYGV